MANLIITIIAIALVAVMAIAGAWYGSSAFQEAQAKADVNQIIASQHQIAGAWRVYALERGGSKTLDNASNVDRYVTNNLVPNYLGTVPRLPSRILHSTAHNSGRDHFYLRASVNFWNSTASLVDMILTSTTRNFCVAFARHVGDDQNDPIRKALTNRNVSGEGETPVDCFWHDLDNDSSMDEDDAYLIIYKVF